ncbi:exonuclease domain-containing protein [Bacteroides intestinalis]|uniref:exonuclease domain-containing protein n=1 Tax=Bacteroides intestinalis TaxID=329854 RepID=UPI001E485701|nr:exonuclease domain-containing protein [Bacteroides intestinalis]
MNVNAYDFIAIDFETANDSRDSACQIGITTVKNGQIKDVKSWLINPESYFNSFNTMIHGITEKDVKDKPTFSELWPEISPYFGNEGKHSINSPFYSKNVMLLL